MGKGRARLLREKEERIAVNLSDGETGYVKEMIASPSSRSGRRGESYYPCPRKRGGREDKKARSKSPKGKKKGGKNRRISVQVKKKGERTHDGGGKRGIE